MANVPNTNTFSLQDVVNAVEPSTDDLQTCFNEADDANFDETYKGDKTNLLNFRNYSIIPNGFGYLYNRYVISSSSFPPIDWKVPTLPDFNNVLRQYVSNNSGRLKETGYTYWNSPNSGALNTYGFSAYGGGWRPQTGGVFSFLLNTGHFWTSSYDGNYYAFRMFSYTTGFEFSAYNLRDGLSVRLLYTGTGTPTTVTDYDGNIYDVVKIGTQYWTAQNWKCTHLNDGTPIPNVTDSGTWSSTSSPARCAYNNDERYV